MACFLIAAFTSALISCTKPQDLPVDQSRPQEVVQAIFDAAASGNLEHLRHLAAPNGMADGDVERVSTVADASPENQASFRDYFIKGQLQGDPVIDGDWAKVDFTFGPDGNKRETMNLRRVNGKWFLESF